MIKVLMACSEAAPFAKTGGLADVLGSLPAALVEKGIDARVIMPLYGCIPEDVRKDMVFVKDINIKLAWRNLYCGIFQYEHRGVIFYFIDNEYFFRRLSLYGFMDEAERFGFLCRAVLEALPEIDFIPDIIHCHDWQTGMIPVFLKAEYRVNPLYEKIRTVFTIHNLKYQGVFDQQILSDILDLDDTYKSDDFLGFNWGISFIKGGLVYSDFITTVSPEYAREIMTPYFGEGLDGLLRSRKDSLSGIVNGIDYVEYDPENDPYIYKNFSLTETEAKAVNKAELQKQLNLEVLPDIPLVGIVSRLVPQKGMDLIAHVLEEIMDLGVELAVLGTGDGRYERLFLDAEVRYRGRVSANIRFDNELAHRIYAGSDIFLMPSEFEPCGLSQLIALRYGTVPVVRETGGLRDTVRHFNELNGEGNGFSFAGYNAHEMLDALRKAVECCSDREKWKILLRNALQSDYGWSNSAGKYIELYKRLNEIS